MIRDDPTHLPLIEMCSNALHQAARGSCQLRRSTRNVQVAPNYRTPTTTLTPLPADRDLDLSFSVGCGWPREFVCVLSVFSVARDCSLFVDFLQQFGFVRTTATTMHSPLPDPHRSCFIHCNIVTFHPGASSVDGLQRMSSLTTLCLRNHKISRSAHSPIFNHDLQTPHSKLKTPMFQIRKHPNPRSVHRLLPLASLTTLKSIDISGDEPE
jgi:hypothetical protein